MKLISLEQYIDRFFGTKKAFADHLNIRQQQVQSMIKRDKTAVLIDDKNKHLYISIRQEFPPK